MSTHCWQVTVRVDSGEDYAYMWRDYHLPFGPLDHEVGISFCGITCCDTGSYDYDPDFVTFDALEGKWRVTIDDTDDAREWPTLDAGIAHWSRAGFVLAEVSRSRADQEVARG